MRRLGNLVRLSTDELRRRLEWMGEICREHNVELSGRELVEAYAQSSWNEFQLLVFEHINLSKPSRRSVISQAENGEFPYSPDTSDKTLDEYMASWDTLIRENKNE